MSRLGIAALLLFVPSVAAGGSARAGGRPSFQVRPAPSWVVPPPAHGASPVTESDTSGLLYMLEDQQLRVTELSTERYYHESYKVTSQAGLDAGSQLKPEFDPTFEELIFHSIRIRRGERIIEALRPREMKLIQPEADLDEREYTCGCSCT